jgi:glucose/arabinose dehydrogenase
MPTPTTRALLLAFLAAAAGLACDSADPIRHNTPPVATITAPVQGATFRAGDVIPYSGSGQDDEDGALPAGALTWWAELHHDTHTHPFLGLTQAASGSVTIPTQGETADNIWYRFYLRVQDSDGNVDTAYTEIFPIKAQMTFTSVPAGRSISLDGQEPRVTPFTITGVAGIERQIGVTSPQVTAETTYAYSSWSDGGTQTHGISTPDHDSTFTVTFTATGPGNHAPTVSLTQPTAGAQFTVNTPVALAATASDDDGVVVVVTFFDGATLIGTDSTAPYQASWTPTVTGPHGLTAVAKDDDETNISTAAVTVIINPAGGGDTQAPVATLTSPTDGTQNLTGALTFTANATDNVGVAGVTFQLDGADLGEDTSSPYSFTLPATTPYATGVHVVRVRARDAAGNFSPWARSRVTFGGDVNVPAGFNLATVASGMNAVGTGMAFAPDGRLFICEQDGDLRVIKNGALLPTPFLTLAVNDDGERGLLGVAFHPNFAGNRYLYVYYTTTSGGSHNRISRFTADPANPDVVLAASESVLVNLPNLSSATNHNGGALNFGSDGKLYVAVGENANGSLAQSDTIVFGKMLRFNDDGSIPTDNPFYGSNTGLNRAIWAKGLRNPFTFAVQPGTGKIYINDVGQSSWEEINQGAAGANYGWPSSEGNQNLASFTGPIFTYGHSANAELITGAAIVGAAFYNPATVLFPSNYVGNFFFGDLTSRFINRLDSANGNAVYAFARISGQVTNMAVGPDGGLYVAVAISGGNYGVYRFAPM